MAYCEDCQRHFATVASLHQHLNNSALHRQTYECDTCTSTFRSQRACNQHMDDVDHWTPQWVCDDCDRSFIGESQLRSHMQSRVHQGLNMKCPFCTRKFAIASHLAAHLESNTCGSGVTREDITRIIREHDTNHVITKRLIGYHDYTHVETYATDASWNGDAYECPVCQKEFGQLKGLNSHLNSPVHQQKIYHCPRRSCGKEFHSLHSLVAHIESQTCNVMQFQQMQGQFHGLIRGQLSLGY